MFAYNSTFYEINKKRKKKMYEMEDGEVEEWKDRKVGKGGERGKGGGRK